MNTELLNRLIKVTNRSKGQTLFLLELLENDFLKLMELEEKIKNNFIFYCPGNKEECEKILKMENCSNNYKLTFKFEN